ncbi:hypothetical protein TNCV_117711 [Trichonephila clavipes]|nr:hypothetical protein TNCV_117711 [Trichonephila clavipes]
MPRAHQAGLRRRSLAGVEFFESVRCHGPGLAQLTNEDVYADKPQPRDHLEDNIRRVIADIRSQMLENSSKIGRPDWTTSKPAMAVLCQKSYLKCNATKLSFE